MEDATQPFQLSSTEDNTIVENTQVYDNNTTHSNDQSSIPPSTTLLSSSSSSSSSSNPTDTIEETNNNEETEETDSNNNGYLTIRRKQQAQNHYKPHPTLLKNLEKSSSSSAAMLEAVEKVRKEQEKAKARAERFGIPYVEPDIRQLNILTKTEYMRLIGQSKPGEVTGFDPTTSSEQDKRAARAARFGTTVFNYEKERLLSAGLTEEAINLRQTYRDRAAKFKQASAIDIAIAKAAVAALGPASEFTEEAVRMSSMEDTDGTVLTSSSNTGDNTTVIKPKEEAIPRSDALHMRAYEYIPASNEDIQAFFSPLRPAYIEWLNGSSLNIIFEDAGTASRALELLSEPIPIVPDVAPVLDSWRFCPKPLIKQKRNEYAPAGAETTVYLRFATNLDTKERAPKTRGARSQGTYSRNGLFSQRAVNAELNRREILQEQIAEGRLNPDMVIKSLVTGPNDVNTAVHIASRIGHALTTTANHLQQQLNPSTETTEIDTIDMDMDKGIVDGTSNNTLKITVDISRSRSEDQPIQAGFVVKRNVRNRVIVRSTAEPPATISAITTNNKSSGRKSLGGKRNRHEEEEELYNHNVDKINLLIKEDEKNLRQEAAIADELNSTNLQTDLTSTTTTTTTATTLEQTLPSTTIESTTTLQSSESNTGDNDI